MQRDAVTHLFGHFLQRTRLQQLGQKLCALFTCIDTAKHLEAAGRGAPLSAFQYSYWPLRRYVLQASTHHPRLLQVSDDHQKRAGTTQQKTARTDRPTLAPPRPGWQQIYLKIEWLYLHLDHCQLQRTSSPHRTVPLKITSQTRLKRSKDRAGTCLQYRGQ